MDQIKIGKFIAECRKKNNLTQMQLAEKLDITDRAISKWENGKAMPDSSIMLDLCKELEISVNELLSGEVIEMNNYNVELEKNLIEMVKQKEESDKRILNLEIVLGLLLAIFFFAIIIIAITLDVADWIRLAIIIPDVILFFTACFFMLGIEQKAGYYECAKCHHKYVPTYSNVFWAMHVGRTRYMKCPKCNEKSWQKKVVSKE